MSELPPPGSDAALDQGCTCPVLDNAHGRGFGNPPNWWFSSGCPLHGMDETCPERGDHTEGESA